MPLHSSREPADFQDRQAQNLVTLRIHLSFVSYRDGM